MHHRRTRTARAGRSASRPAKTVLRTVFRARESPRGSVRQAARGGGRALRRVPPWGFSFGLYARRTRTGRRRRSAGTNSPADCLLACGRVPGEVYGGQLGAGVEHAGKKSVGTVRRERERVPAGRLAGGIHAAPTHGREVGSPERKAGGNRRVGAAGVNARPTMCQGRGNKTGHGCPRGGWQAAYMPPLRMAGRWDRQKEKRAPPFPGTKGDAPWRVRPGGVLGVIALGPYCTGGQAGQAR